MSGLSLKLRGPLTARLDLSGVTPDRLAGLAESDIAHLPLVHRTDGARLGDFFDVSGTPGERLVITSGSTFLDNVGEGLVSGLLVVEGDAGDNAGRFMKGGHLDIRGSAGHGLATCLRNGLVTVAGSAGDYAGAMTAGERFGMSGGTVVVGGDIGERTGDRMRRGSIVVRGKTGPAAGARMAGGTIVAEGGFGAMPGALLRRGTLIGPSVAEWLPTFADCGLHDLNIVKILNRHFAEHLGPLAPRPISLMVRRYAGDLATIGKGEILITA